MMNKFDKHGPVGQTWYEYTVALLVSRGVKLDDIADLVYDLQKDYIDDLTYEIIYPAIESVLHNREVQNYIIMGIEQDVLAEKHAFSQPYQTIMENDEGLFGADELLALGICNVYGSIGFTNFGYVDKIKPHILDWLNDKATGYINVFLDDIVGAVAAASAAKLAHRNPGENSVYNRPIDLSEIKRLTNNQRQRYSKKAD